MLPNWMKETDCYAPENSGHSFILKTYKAIGRAMADVAIQRGEEKSKSFPALLKLIGTLFAIILISATRNDFVFMICAAVILLFLCALKPEEILKVLKPVMAAGIIATIIVLPAMFMNPDGIRNNIFLVLRVFLSVTCLSLFNHSTQWNHITGALKKVHVPSLFIFILDITLKFIVLMGNMIVDMLTALLLRSVGKNQKKYNSVGGVMGTTFVRGTELNHQMFEAMQCRGFTGDY